MKKKARTISKSSATSFNFGENKIRRSNSRKAAPKKARVSTSDAQEWTVGKTDLNTLRPIKDCQVRLPAGLPTDTRGGDATTLTVGTKAGKTLSQPSAPVLREEFSQALRCLEKRVSQIEGLLSNFSPIVTDEAITWTCPEDKHPSPELQKMWMEMVWEREVHPPQERIPVNPFWTVSDNDSLYVKERRRSWKEPDRRQRPERRENNRRALERLPISGTPSAS